ncbi:MAG TPA: TonB-dependent receptor, partial [Sphingomicrobium sp.]|nr:TonB-dependent receptor [Sphingomicrobium sp.]
GGAIKYVTKRLSADPEFRVRANYGSYDQADLILSASMPLTEGFRVGASAARLSRGGFGTNLTTGKENYNKDIWAFRGTLEMEPTDRIFIRMTGDHTLDKSESRGGHRLITSLRSLAPVLDDVYDTRGGLDSPEQKVKGGGMALHVDVGLTDALKLRSIGAYRADTSKTPIDFDALPTVSLDVPGIYRNNQLSQELQLLYEGDRLNGVAGVYFLDAEAITLFDARLYDLGALIGFPGFTASTESTIDTKTWAVFGDFTFDISAQFSVSAGGRYTNDKRKGRVLRRSWYFGGSPTFGGSPPYNVGTQLGGPTSNFTGKRTDTAFTPRISLSFKPTPDHHLYASWSKGFKGGGFDPRGQSNQAPDLDGDGIRGDADPQDVYEYMTFEPEKVTSFEIGYKASLFDRRISTGIALFNADYKDMQIPASQACVVGGIPNFCGVTSNAGKARIRGIEWEGNARLFGDPGGAQRLNFGWSLGYLDGKFKEFMSLVAYEENGTPIPLPGRLVNLADHYSIQNTPKWTASGTLSYLAEIAGGDLSLSSTLSYRSDSQQFEWPTPGIDQKAFSLWDASAVYTLPGGRYSIGLHGKNLTDKQYKLAGYNYLWQNPWNGQFILLNGQPGYSPASNLGQEGILSAFYGNPRQVFVSLSAKF